jgi:hypothetical protein
LLKDKKQKGDTYMDLTTLFYVVDEFTKSFEPEWRKHLVSSGEAKRIKPCSLSMSEILTILIHFHQSDYRKFKNYYLDYVQGQLAGDFPGLVSYNRFVELMSGATAPLCMLLISLLGQPGIANYIDSTKLVVCHNRRIRRHKVFKGLAERGKSSMGWFFGFKLHITVNDQGQITSFLLTPGNTPDNNIPVVTKLVERLTGKLFGDKGYISSDLFRALWAQGVHLVTGIRRNMKNRLLPVMDKIMLRGRSIIETINDQLKNQEQIEHTRHRSPKNFLVNLLGGLVAYQLQPKKPALHFTKAETELTTMPVLLPATS